jgi:hypothetical protein
MSLETLLGRARDLVARERERQDSADRKVLRDIAERAGKIAERTPAYDVQRKRRASGDSKKPGMISRAFYLPKGLARGGAHKINSI